MTFGRKKKIFVACRRTIPREPVTLAGSAMSIARSRSVTISDLSAEGAGIAGRDLPSPGENLLLVVGSIDRLGKVMWRRGERCGIRVDQPLRRENILRMKQEGSWESVIGYASI